MSSRSPLALLLAAGTIASLATASHAVVRVWTNAAGGSAATGSNWSPAATPTSADVLNYNLASTYSVSFPSTVTSVLQQNFSGTGTVTLSALVPHTITQQFAIGLAAGSNTTVNVNSGTFSSPFVAVANSATAQATLNVSGASTLLLATGTNGLRVGNTGDGSMSIFASGVARVTGPVSVATLAGSSGTITVSGGGLLETTDAINGTITVGAQGNGTLNTSNGRITAASDVIIAPTAGFTGSSTISNSATNGLVTSGDVFVGANETANPAGTGSLTIGTSICRALNGTMRVGDPNGGTGTLALTDDTSSVIVRNLIIDAGGTLDFRRGDLEVRGGTFTPRPGTFTLNASGSGLSGPSLLLSGPALSTVGGFIIGDTASGDLILENGADVSTGSTIVARGTSSISSLTLSDSGTSFAFPGNALTIAIGGEGLVTAESGSSLSGATVTIAQNPGSEGELILRDPGTTCTLANNLSLGTINSASSPTLSVLNGATLTCGGNVNLNASASRVFLSSNGTVNATSLTRPDFTLVQGSGRINANMNSPVAFSATITATGPLDMGRDSVASSFLNSGTLNVGTHPVTIRSLDFARAGEITIAGGSVTSSARLMFANGDELAGFGTINAEAAFGPSVPITATGSGLRFTDVVTSISPPSSITMTGSRVTFSPTANFIGNGTISAELHAEPGSIIDIQGGNATLGNAATGDGLVLAGTLRVNNNTVTLRKGDIIQLGTLTTITGGTLTSTPRIALDHPDDVLQGRGTISAIFSSGGHVDPVAHLDLPGGILNFTSSFSANSASTLEFDITGNTPGPHDQITVAGVATLGGTLIARLGSHTPNLGDTFTIITASTRSGVFTNVDAPGFQVDFLSDRVNLIFIGTCITDYNQDGGGDTSDVLDLANDIASGTESFPPNVTDFNSDGGGDTTDVLDLANAIASGACP